MPSSVHSIRTSVVSGVSTTSSSSSGKSKLTRSTGRGGMGNIKRAASHDPLAPIFTVTLDQYSVSGREAPVSPTSSSKATRSTGRGGSGNIGRARARSAATPLPAQTASIVAQYEEAKARRERALITDSTNARKKNVGASGRGGAGNNYLRATLPSASSSKLSIRSSTRSYAAPSIATTTSDGSPLPPMPSYADTDEPEFSRAGLNPRYKPRSTLWSKIARKDGKSKKGKSKAAGSPRASLDQRSILDIAAALPAELDTASASFQASNPTSPSPRAARRSTTSSSAPSAYRHAVIFPTEANEDTVSMHTLSPRDRAGSWSTASGSMSGSGSASTVSIIASSDSYSLRAPSPAAWRAPQADAELNEPEEEEVTPWVAPGGPPRWWHARPPARVRARTASDSTGVLSVRSHETGSAPASDSASALSVRSRETGHTFGSIPSARSVQTSASAPASVAAPSPQRPTLHARTATEITVASVDSGLSTASRDGARAIRRVGMMLLEPPALPSSAGTAPGMTVPSTLTLSLLPSAPPTRTPSPLSPQYLHHHSLARVPPSPTAPSYPPPSLPSSRAAPSPRTPSIALVPPTPFYGAGEYPSDEEDVDPTLPASLTRRSLAASLSPSIAGASMYAEPSTPSAVERTAFIVEPAPLPPVPLLAAARAARPHVPTRPPPPVPGSPPALEPVPEPHPEREPRLALPTLVLPARSPPSAWPGVRAADASPASMASGSPYSPFPHSATASSHGGPSWGELLRLYTGPGSASDGDADGEWDEDWNGEALPPYTPTAAYNERPLPTPGARWPLAAEGVGVHSPLRALRAVPEDGGEEGYADNAYMEHVYAEDDSVEAEDDDDDDDADSDEETVEAAEDLLVPGAQWPTVPRTVPTLAPTLVLPDVPTRPVSSFFEF